MFKYMLMYRHVSGHNLYTVGRRHFCKQQSRPPKHTQIFVSKNNMTKYIGVVWFVRSWLFGQSKYWKRFPLTQYLVRQGSLPHLHVWRRREQRDWTGGDKRQNAEFVAKGGTEPKGRS